MDQNDESPKVVFKGEEFRQSSRSFQKQTPKLVRWVVKYSGGSIKDEKQANYFLIAFAVVAFSISIFLVLGERSVKPSNSATQPRALSQ